jgi:hypothetical protein
VASEPSGHRDRAGSLSKNRLAVLGTASVGVLSARGARLRASLIPAPAPTSTASSPSRAAACEGRGVRSGHSAPPDLKGVKKLTELMQAHRQWMSRAPDERFTSLLDMQDFKRRVRDNSRSQVISNRGLTVRPVEDDARALQIMDTATAFQRRRRRIGLSGNCVRSPAPATRRPATSATRTCLPQ